MKLTLYNTFRYYYGRPTSLFLTLASSSLITVFSIRHPHLRGDDGYEYGTLPETNIPISSEEVYYIALFFLQFLFKNTDEKAIGCMLGGRQS
jgi:hypothetical protein